MNNLDNKNVFQFKNPQQVKIHRLLSLIGTGAAAFYLDACKIMENNLGLSTSTHLVSHCLREIESSLLKVLEPFYQKGINQLT